MFQCWNSDMGTYKCMSAHFVRRHTIPHTSKDVLSFRLSHTSRCFKAIMFLTGFIFGSIVVYLICLEEGIFPLWANTVIAVSAGILFGLITLLVQYVGLFMLGKEKTSKTTFNNDQLRSGKEKDLWLETLWKKVSCLKGKSKKETSACPWVPMYVSLLQQCSADV